MQLTRLMGMDVNRRQTSNSQDSLPLATFNLLGDTVLLCQSEYHHHMIKAIWCGIYLDRSIAVIYVKH